ncbi:MAG: YdcF family protein [Parvibaculum sp.]
MAIDPELVNAINRYLLVRTEIEPADLCFVFGTRHGALEFADETARLWHERYFPHVLISGGVTPGDTRSEASVMRDLLIERGVSVGAILVEECATNTGENVEFSLPVIDHALGLPNVRSLIAVGKFRTSRRYLMTLQKHWPEVKKMLVPVHYHDVEPSRWMDHPELCDAVIAEWERLVPYFKKGFIHEVDLPGVEFRPKGLS